MKFIALSDLAAPALAECREVRAKQESPGRTVQRRLGDSGTRTRDATACVESELRTRIAILKKSTLAAPGARASNDEGSLDPSFPLRGASGVYATGLHLRSTAHAGRSSAIRTATALGHGDDGEAERLRLTSSGAP